MKLKEVKINAANKDDFFIFSKLVKKYSLTILTSGYIKKKYYLISKEDASALLSKYIVDKRKKLKAWTIVSGTMDDLNIWLIHAEHIDLLANRGY